jgi:hypothetical protein
MGQIGRATTSDDQGPEETSALTPRRKSKPKTLPKPKHGSRYATMADLERFAENMGEFVGQALKEHVAFDYTGTYEAGRSVSQGPGLHS